MEVQRDKQIDDHQVQCNYETGVIFSETFCFCKEKVILNTWHVYLLSHDPAFFYAKNDPQGRKR